MGLKDLVFETATNTYKALKVVGEGGSGRVYLVADVDEREFALKCLYTSDSSKKKRFSNELNYCQKGVHRNVIRILDSGVLVNKDERQPFYVMPHYPGTLRTRMVAGIAPEHVLPLFDQVLSGIEAAHLGQVVHRDLKPENILYDPSENRLVVADFGIAHFEEEDLLTAVETKNQDRLMNYIYAAPEQKNRPLTVDSRADIFALGLMLNELFTGKVPLGEGYPLIANAAPQYAYLDGIVNKMIRHLASERYANVGMVKEEILFHGNAFVELQKLDQLRRQVVPAATPDDPLGGRDVEVVNAEYLSGEIVFFLEPQPPQEWFTALRGLGEFTQIFGIAEPSRVRPYPNGTMGLSVPSRSIDQVVPIVKRWVVSTNREYRLRMEQKAAKEHSERMAALQRERVRAEETARVNQTLRDLLKQP